MKQRDPNSIYTEDELAELLHTSRYSLRCLRQAGKIRHIQVGRAILYPDQYLQEYIDRHGAPMDVGSSRAPVRIAGR